MVSADRARSCGASWWRRCSCFLRPDRRDLIFSVVSVVACMAAELRMQLLWAPNSKSPDRAGRRSGLYYFWVAVCLSREFFLTNSEGRALPGADLSFETWKSNTYYPT